MCCERRTKFTENKKENEFIPEFMLHTPVGLPSLVLRGNALFQFRLRITSHKSIR